MEAVAAPPAPQQGLPQAETDDTQPRQQQQQSRRRPATAGGAPPRPRRRSRRALSAADSADSGVSGGYTTSLVGRMTPPIERVHQTLEAPQRQHPNKRDVVDGAPSALPTPLEEDEREEDHQEQQQQEEEEERRQGGQRSGGKSSAGSAVRRRRRRITRRLASPRSVLVGSGHYLISPWTTELDEDNADDENEWAVGDAGTKPSAQRRRPASCPMDEIMAEERDADFGRGGREDGLRRRRRSRRSNTATTSTSSLESLASDKDEAKAAAAAARKSERAKIEEAKSALSFTTFRITYLIVHIAIMLADGLQGTHLYVLYEGYGYSVSSLYCLGFVSGALTSPFIGPFVDKFGRKKSAVLYCALEVFINLLEQYPLFAGLIVSRVVGGVTTNLLFSVFESWLVTEHRRRKYAEDKLETILRDSSIVSNLAAIASGWLAHWLAGKYGPVGPFEGAVTCTAVALVLVSLVWTENYGCSTPGHTKSIKQYMSGALRTIASDSNIFRIGIIQGFSEGALQTFVFLWSPALRHFSTHAPKTALGLDSDGEPAYGLIFGAFMACGVLGGLAEPTVRRVVTHLVRDRDRRAGIRRRDTVVFRKQRGNSSDSGSGSDSDASSNIGEDVKPAAVEFLTTLVYFTCACLLLTPFLLPRESPHSFSIALGSFLVYEFMIGLYMPCEGIIRSIYMPTASICSLMTMLRVIVNVCVALGVVSTNFIPFATAFAIIATLMFTSAAIQLTLVSPREWSNFVGRIKVSRRESFKMRHLSVLGKSSSSSSSSTLSTPVKNGRGKGGCDSDSDAPPPPLEYSPGSALSHVEETSSSDFEEEEDNIVGGDDSD